MRFLSLTSLLVAVCLLGLALGCKKSPPTNSAVDKESGAKMPQVDKKKSLPPMPPP
jgi:hypothetical protein